MDEAKKLYAETSERKVKYDVMLDDGKTKTYTLSKINVNLSYEDMDYLVKKIAKLQDVGDVMQIYEVQTNMIH
ncbi:hypothetical protein [Ligilactobacillus salivarius]|uniref:hypothetical protein n=1 Tax=Ligilactobacillus salivarius TaxID=1624 RepID=UPI0033162EF4